MAGGLESDLQYWASQGYSVVAMTLLLDNPNNGFPEVSDAMTWKQQFGITNAYVAPDPSWQMVPGMSVNTPQISVVDPRTMQVVHLQNGTGGSYESVLLNLAAQNQ